MLPNDIMQFRLLARMLKGYRSVSRYGRSKLSPPKKRDYAVTPLLGIFALTIHFVCCSLDGYSEIDSSRLYCETEVDRPNPHQRILLD